MLNILLLLQFFLKVIILGIFLFWGGVPCSYWLLIFILVFWNGISQCPGWLQILCLPEFDGEFQIFCLYLLNAGIPYLVGFSFNGVFLGSFKYFMWMSILPAYMYVCCTCAWCLQRSEEGIRSLRTGTTDVSPPCEPPCKCWEPIPGPLQEQLYKGS